MPLPPDPDSLVQVIKRAHFQTFEWLRCCQPVINHLNLQIVEGKLRMMKLSQYGTQGVKCHHLFKENELGKKIDGSIADDEISDTECLPKTKKSRKTAPQKAKGKVAAVRQ